MKQNKLLFLILILLILIQPKILVADSSVAMLTKNSSSAKAINKLPKNIKLRGWEHLASNLVDEGVPADLIIKAYSSTRIPRFTKVSFSLNPKESSYMYSKFITKSNLNSARNFIKNNKKTFDKVESEFNVNPEVIAAILLVETHFGTYTGNNSVFYRLSRLANISDPKNLQYNYIKEKKEDSSVTFSQVINRAKYLEDTFLPEIIALIELAKENNISYMNVKGSSAGAFGWSQFLPSSYLKYSIDFNKDSKRSLYNKEDAIASVANYLKAHGWKDSSSLNNRRDVIWKYNKSEAYIDTVLKIAKLI